EMIHSVSGIGPVMHNVGSSEKWAVIVLHTTEGIDSQAASDRESNLSPATHTVYRSNLTVRLNCKAISQGSKTGHILTSENSSAELEMGEWNNKPVERADVRAHRGARNVSCADVEPWSELKSPGVV